MPTIMFDTAGGTITCDTATNKAAYGGDFTPEQVGRCCDVFFGPSLRRASLHISICSFLRLHSWRNCTLTGLLG